MGDLKSLLALWQATVEYRTGPLYSKQSVSYVLRRVEEEGLSFLTSGLPKIAKGLITVFQGGAYAVPLGFRLASPRIPRLFSELFLEILTPDGYLRTDRSERYISQIVGVINDCCYFAYKLEIEPTPEQISASLESLTANDRRLRKYTVGYYETVPELQHARILIRRLLAGVDPSSIVPRHSNGAVAEGHRYNPIARWDTEEIDWPTKLDKVFPHSKYYYVNYDHLVDSQIVDGAYLRHASRIAFVPKDSRGPRTICCEPCGSQFIEQGLMDLLNKTIEGSRIRELSYTGISQRWISTSAFIPTRDQSIMKDLARAGSISGQLATIDLEKASDSVPWNLIRYLFPSQWVQALNAVKSDLLYTSENGSSRILIDSPNMAFPMGSSTCFPIECLVFWAISKAAGRPHSNAWVYGDDIIVETEDATNVVSLLRRCGFLVNNDKSFFEGPFRESCGGDYLYGNDVRATYLRRFPTEKGNVIGQRSEYLSLVAFVNQIEEKGPLFGSPCSVSPLRSVVDAKYIFPVHPVIALAYRYGSPSRNILFKQRWNAKLQRSEIKTLVTKPRKKKTYDGWNGYRKSLLTFGRNSAVVRYDDTVVASWVSQDY